jgi:hypothetical protein
MEQPAALEASPRPLTADLVHAALPLLAVATGASWLLLRGIDHRFISFSDGVYLYAASIGPHAFYGEIPLSLPPGTVLFASLLWKLSAHVETVRAALAALGILTAFMTYRVGRAAFGLGTAAAAVAALAALTGPLHAQFVGLEGEAFLTPLALALALALTSERYGLAAVLLGLGFFFKLTWLPFVVAGVVTSALRRGAKKSLTLSLGALLVSFAPYAAAVVAFHWSVHDLATQLVVAQSYSGLQPDVLLGLVAALVVMWWPFAALAGPGFRRADRAAGLVAAAAGTCFAFTLKQGTFFNVLDPLEPFLALAAVAGAASLWRRRRPLARGVVVACALAAVVHVASVTNASLGRALPLPLGAAIVNTDDQATVDRIAGTIAARSKPGQPVLVNPFFALVAHRHEPADAADWFILRSLERYCAANGRADAHCTDWQRVKAAACTGRVRIVSIDSNVASFDRSFARDTAASERTRLLHVDAPPIKTDLFGAVPDTAR